MNAAKAFRIFITLMVLVSLVPPAAAEDEATVLWTTTIASGISSIQYIDDTSEVVVGTEGNQVLLLDSSGNTQWTTTLSATYPFDKVNATIVADSSDYIWAYSNHTAYLLARSTGAVQWSVTNTTDDEMIVAAAAAKNAGYYTYATPSTVYMFNSTGGMIGGYKPNSNYRTMVTYNWTDLEMDPNAAYIYGSTTNATRSIDIYKSASYTDSTTCSAPGLNYTYRFTNSGNMDVATYQVVLDTTNQSLFEAAGNDATKLEVYQSDGTTPLPFWVQNFTTGAASTTSAGPYNLRMWITLPSLAAGGTYTVIVRVNPSRTDSLSNGYSTFKFFDHFDSATLNLTQWNVTKIKTTSGTNTLSNSMISVSTNTAAGTWGYMLDAIQQKGGFQSGENVSVDFWNTSMSPSASTGWMGVSDQWDTDVRHGGAGSGDGTTFYMSNTPSVTYYTTENDAFSNPSFTVDTKLGQWWQSVLNVTSGKAFTNETLRTSSAANIPTGSPLHVYLGGYGGGATVVSDAVWVRNFTVNGPAQTTYMGNNTLWTCEAWTPFNIYNLSTTGNRVFGPMTRDTRMGIDNVGAWLAISNASYEVKQAVSAGSFTTTYAYASSSGVPTAHPSIAQSGSFSIEGRGSGIFDIIRLDATRVGTYTAGSTANSVAMSNQGLYAVGGSSDGVDYIFSKASTSSWTVLYSSDPGGAVSVVDMSGDGTYVASGRADGTVTLYHIGEATNAYFTFTVSKNGAPYSGAAIAVEDGGTTGLTYVPLVTGTLDSYGTYSPKLNYGRYYRITIGSSEKVEIIYTSSNQLNYMITIGGVSPAFADVDFQITYNWTTNDIWLFYNNKSSTTDTVTWKIYRVVDNSLQATITNDTASPSHAPPPVLYNWTVPAIWRNSSYRVVMSAEHSSKELTHTQVLFVTNASAPVGGMSILPPGMDTYIKIAIAFVLLAMFGGIFSYITGPEGALVVSIAAGGLRLFDVLPLDWGPTILVCLLFAFIGLLGRKGSEQGGG